MCNKQCKNKVVDLSKACEVLKDTFINSESPNYGIQNAEIDGEDFTVAIIRSSLMDGNQLSGRLNHVLEISCCEASQNSHGFHHDHDCEKYNQVD